MAESDDALQQVITAVESVQNLDPQTIARTETLGSALDFSPALPSFRRTIDFFSQIPLKHIPDLPEPQRAALKSHADAFFAIFQKLMSFTPAQAPNAAEAREQLIAEVNAGYAAAFAKLFPLVSYLGSRERDISEVQREARQAVDAARAEADALSAQMQEAAAESQRVLAEIRRTAAEAGVSQQAHYFAEQATSHSNVAKNWQKYTAWTAIGLAAFAALTVVVGRYVLVPATPYEAVQLGLSKLLIFSTIAYLLFICSRTLLAHRHNEIVNKHRQNALLTFNALVDAAGTTETREIVLTHASACIFSPQESGFTKGGSSQSPNSLIEVLPRAALASQRSLGG